MSHPCQKGFPPIQPKGERTSQEGRSSALRKALKEETKDSAVLIIAQRINTILNADQIIVLNEGKTAGIGTHEELMEHCSVYREIAKSQMRGGEN